ncbi:MAG: hypothetical protein HEP71_06770 [Roseivirga sp.]|nr:hypothetical protein [Roseivirga sp.]
MNSAKVNKSSLASLSFIYLLILSLSSCGQAVATSKSSSIKDARQAFERREHAKAYSIFERIWEDKQQSLADRTLSGQYLAKMNWILYGKNARAYDILRELEKTDHERSTALVLRSRILEEEGKVDKAIVMAEKAMGTAASETEKYNSQLAFCSRVLEKSRKSLLDKPSQFVAKTPLTNSAYNILSEIVRENSRDGEAARLYLSYSLLLKKGTEAFKAWMLFFHHKAIDEIHPTLLTEPGKFKTALENYGNGTSDKEYAVTIVKGLAESGFYHAAVLLKNKEFGTEPHEDVQINDIVVYEGFLNQVKDITRQFYQKATEGNGEAQSFTRQYNQASEQLWLQLSWNGERPTFSTGLFTSTQRERFKTLTKFMTTSNHYGLHMGHVILDDRRTISQFGQSAEFRYKVVDHMISNGYVAWFSDGNSQVGGWATNDGSFLQIRAGLGGEMTRIWQMLTDPVESKKILDDIDRFTSLEDTMAEENPYAFLPSLKLRLVYYQSTALLDSLKATGLGGPDLRVGFINLMEEMALDAKIYAHEGRHSIDMKRNYSNSSKELEFTAKLSEIYFSARPLLFLGTIIGPNMGDGTSHGDANLKLVKGLVGWMNQHKNKIRGFDKSRPTLPQLDKLSNEQLREAVRSMDPMAN